MHHQHTNTNTNNNPNNTTTNTNLRRSVSTGMLDHLDFLFRCKSDLNELLPSAVSGGLTRSTSTRSCGRNSTPSRSNGSNGQIELLPRTSSLQALSFEANNIPAISRTKTQPNSRNAKSNRQKSTRESAHQSGSSAATKKQVASSKGGTGRAQKSDHSDLTEIFGRLKGV